MNGRSLAAVALLAMHCSSYGLADRPGETVTNAPFAVHTVIIDASTSADAALLTRGMVSALQRHGIPNARWTTDATIPAIACEVDVEEEAIENAARVVASATCDVDGTTTVRRDAATQLQVAPSDRVTDRSRAVELAAGNALEAAASEVARLLTPDETSDGSKEK